MKRARRWIIDILLVGVICLALLEVCSRLYVHYFWPSIPLSTSAAWRIAWVNRPHTLSNGRPEMYDPLIGWKNKPNFRNEGPLFGAERVSTNAKGARNAVNYPYNRTERKRIVVVGDSFAFGEEVNDEETYSALLESRLPNTEVINLGVGGYGVDQILLTLKEEALKYSPDLVIVGVVSADLERSLLSFRDFAKPMFVPDGAKLQLVGRPVAEPEVWLANEVWRPKVLDVMNVVTAELARVTGVRQRHAFDITMMLWSEMLRVAEEANTKLLFVFGPISGEITGDDRADLVAMRKDSEAYRSNKEYFGRSFSAVARFGEQWFLNFVQEKKAMSLNLAPVFRMRYQEGDKRVGKQGHWDAYGHAVVAAEIEKKLLAEGWADGQLSSVPSAPVSKSNAPTVE